MIWNVFDWLRLGDYDRKSKDAERSVIARYARRNVRMQSDDSLDFEQFDHLIKSGDAAIERLKARRARASS